MSELKLEQKVLLDLLRGIEITYSDKLNIEIFKDILIRHRLLLMVADSMSTFFQSHKATFDTSVKKEVIKSMALAGQLIMIYEMFSGRSELLLVTKGPVLSMMLYGNLTGRQYNDLDIHVAQSEIHQVLNELVAGGFQVIYPRIKMGFPLKYYFKHKQDIGLFNPKTEAYIELHCGFNARRLVPVKSERDFFSNLSQVQIMDREIQTLDNETHFIYLCLHGSKHLFFRLFWLKDIADYLKYMELDLDRIINMTEQYKIKRIIGLCLILVKDFFEYEIPEKLQSYLYCAGANKLARVCKRRIFQPEKEDFYMKVVKSIYFLKIKTGFNYRAYQITSIFHRWYIRKFLGGH
jgi:hypothetical protein